MSEQASLFEGEERKITGIATVLEHTPESYATLFISIISNYDFGHEFTSEDVTARIGQPPNHPNAVGALTNKAARAGLIVSTGRRVKAQRPNQHAAKLEVWKRIS